MKATVALTLLAFFVVLPQIAQGTPSSSETCSGASQTASKAAQDYRNAVGKVDIACNSSAEECQQQRLQADAVLNTAISANQQMLAVCTFTGGSKGNDSLAVAEDTVTAAIGLLPETVLIPCKVLNFGGVTVSAGCPNGWLLNLQEIALTVLTATATSFDYTFNLHLVGSIPIDAGPPFSSSCT